MSIMWVYGSTSVTRTFEETGLTVPHLSDEDIIGALAALAAFIVLMGLGVWHVFRKRGRIYI